MSEWVAQGNEGEGCTSFGRPCSLVGQLVVKLGKVALVRVLRSVLCLRCGDTNMNCRSL